MHVHTIHNSRNSRFETFSGVFLHKLSDFSFSQKLIFLHPFHPLITSLCNVYQCLTLYFERPENTPFSPPRHGFKAGRETTRWCFMQPISPQVLQPPLKPQGRQREASPFFHLPFAGESRVPRVVERRRVYELYVVRLARVAS